MQYLCSQDGKDLKLGNTVLLSLPVHPPAITTCAGLGNPWML